MKDYGAHLMCHVDEGPSCVRAERTNHLNLILSCENTLDQRDKFMRRVVTADQASAGRRFETGENGWVEGRVGYRGS